MGNLQVPKDNVCCYIEDGIPCSRQAKWRLHESYDNYTELCDEHLNEVKEDTDNIEAL